MSRSLIVALLILVACAPVASAVVPGPPQSQRDPYEIFTIGDSFASGEGAPDTDGQYNDDGDLTGAVEDWDNRITGSPADPGLKQDTTRCHRSGRTSTSAVARQLFADEFPDIVFNWKSVACGGASIVQTAKLDGNVPPDKGGVLRGYDGAENLSRRGIPSDQLSPDVFPPQLESAQHHSRRAAGGPDEAHQRPRDEPRRQRRGLRRAHCQVLQHHPRRGLPHRYGGGDVPLGQARGAQRPLQPPGRFAQRRPGDRQRRSRARLPARRRLPDRRPEPAARDRHQLLRPPAGGQLRGEPHRGRVAVAGGQRPGPAQHALPDRGQPAWLEPGHESRRQVLRPRAVRGGQLDQHQPPGAAQAGRARRDREPADRRERRDRTPQPERVRRHRRRAVRADAPLHHGPLHPGRRPAGDDPVERHRLRRDGGRRQPDRAALRLLAPRQAASVERRRDDHERHWGRPAARARLRDARRSTTPAPGATSSPPWPAARCRATPPRAAGPSAPSCASAPSSRPVP